MTKRLADTIRFYGLLDRLAARIGGPRMLGDCHGRMDWPPHGVYFFYESGEDRSGTNTGQRVVRVGTHALKSGAQSTLWRRLSQHRGSPRTGGGNHRGSVFRLLLGIALARRCNIEPPASWGVAGSASKAARRLNRDRTAVKEAEAGLEVAVSTYVAQMPFLWLGVSDPPGPHSNRGVIERNAIALLSGYGWPAADGPSLGWLGHHSDRDKVRHSGLWNNNHVDETYNPAFLDEMELRIDAILQ